jgi:hypothetical protein
MMYSLDNNYNAFREQATTADGQLRNKLYCDRMGVNHTAKPVMEDKDETWKYDIMFRVLEVRFYFANFICLSEYYQKTRVFCTMLFTVGGFLSILWFSQTVGGGFLGSSTPNGALRATPQLAIRPNFLRFILFYIVF